MCMRERKEREIVEEVDIKVRVTNIEVIERRGFELGCHEAREVESDVIKFLLKSMKIK